MSRILGDREDKVCPVRTCVERKPLAGGGSIYYQRIADVAARDYDGFVFEEAHGVDDVGAA